MEGGIAIMARRYHEIKGLYFLQVYISHTNKISKHGLGMAVDINTLYNPYHKGCKPHDCWFC